MNTLTAFVYATAERAIKTFAQSLAALLVADGTDVIHTAWQDRLSVAGMAALLSVLTSVASAPIGKAGPSLTTEETEAGYGAVELLIGVLVVVILVLLILRLA